MSMKGCEYSLICLIVSALFAYKICQAAGVNICGTNEKIPCDNSECISRHGLCDGEIDCADESDEKYCEKRFYWFQTVPDNHCTEKHFVCENGPCIPAVARCDEFDDCSDYSDEVECEETIVANLGHPVSQEEELYFLNDNTTDSVGTHDDAYRRSSTWSTSTTTTTMRPTTTATLSSSTRTVPSRYRTTNVPLPTSYYSRRQYEKSTEQSGRDLHYQNPTPDESLIAKGNKSSDTETLTEPHEDGHRNTEDQSILATPMSIVRKFVRPTEASFPSEVGLTVKARTENNVIPKENSLATRLKTEHEITMQYRKKEHELAMKHKKEQHELTMQHKIKEHELTMQHKREELEFTMHLRREEQELIMQRKREHQLIMEHKREEHEITMENEKAEHELIMQHKREQHELIML